MEVFRELTIVDSQDNIDKLLDALGVTYSQRWHFIKKWPEK